MNREQKIVTNIMWGVGATIGLFVAGKIRDLGVAGYERYRRNDEVEIIEEVVVEES